MRRNLGEDDQIALGSLLDYQVHVPFFVTDLMISLYDIVNDHKYNNLHV